MTPAAMTVAQLAERWNVHPETIRKKVASGELPKIPLFQHIRIPMKAILEAEDPCGSNSTEENGRQSGPTKAERDAAASAQATVTRLSADLPISALASLTRASE